MQEIALAAILGFFIGWILRSLLEPPKPRDPFEHRAVISVGHSSWILRDIDGDRLRALAARFAAGRAITYASLTGRGRLFSKPEWGRVRKELIRAQIFKKERDGTLTPTPEGRQILINIANGMDAQGRMRARGVEVPLKWR